MLLILGVKEIYWNPIVFKAINPYYAFHLLMYYKEGFWFKERYFFAQREQKHCILIWDIVEERIFE